MKRRRAITLGLMLLPAAFLYAMFFLYPMVRGVSISFFRWEGISPDMTYIGLKNFSTLLHDSQFYTALTNSFILTGAALAIQIPLGFIFAWIAFNRKRFGRVFIWFVYLPMVISYIAVGLMWSWMLNPKIGIINSLLEGIGLESLAIGWLSSRWTALFSVIMATTWQGVGFTTIFFWAGLGGIRRSIFDAMEVDGISGFKGVRRIILPQLKETIAVAFIFIASSSLKAFDLIYALTGGGPARTTEVLGLTMYREAFDRMSAGYASAYGVAILLLGLILIAVYLKLTGGRESG